jgi:hypothetical protein
MDMYKLGRRLLRFRSVRKAESARNGTAVRVVTDGAVSAHDHAARAGAAVDGVVAWTEQISPSVRLVAGFDCLDDWTDDGAVGMRGWYY